MRRQVNGEQVKDDIQGAIRIQVEIPYQAHNTLPDLLCVCRKDRHGLGWKTS